MNEKKNLLLVIKTIVYHHHFRRETTPTVILKRAEQLNQTTMETSTNTHYTSPDENDTVFVQTEPSSSRAGDNSSETDNSGDSLTKSSDLLAKGLSSILSTVIRDFDFRAQQTLMSQNHLSSSIDRLTGGIFCILIFSSVTNCITLCVISKLTVVLFGFEIFLMLDCIIEYQN